MGVDLFLHICPLFQFMVYSDEDQVTEDRNMSRAQVMGSVKLQNFARFKVTHSSDKCWSKKHIEYSYS